MRVMLLASSAVFVLIEVKLKQFEQGPHQEKTANETDHVQQCQNVHHLTSIIIYRRNLIYYQ